jgi:ketosteroid isomerase-like protein
MRLKAIIFLPLAFCLLTCSSRLPEASAGAESDTLAVQKAVENFIEAFNNLEWERFRLCFSGDVTVFNPAISEVSDLHRADGKEKVEAIFRGVFDAARKEKASPPHLNIQPKELKIQMLKDAAIVTFHFDRGESSFGRRTLVFQKQGGRWLIVHLHASNVVRQK